MQITLTLDLTPRTLKILEQLCEEPKPVELKPNESVPEPYVEEPPHEEPKKKLSAADVKAVCLKFSKEGRQSELKAAFAKFGAKKLTEISEDDYPALMEELGNG